VAAPSGRGGESEAGIPHDRSGPPPLGLGALLLAAGLGLVGAGASAAEPCAGLAPPTPTVEIEVAAPARPRIVPAADGEMRRRAGEFGGAHAEAGVATRGLASSRLVGRASYTMTKVEPRPGGRACLALRSVSARFANEDVTILVDRRYPEGSCEREAILAHEREHVRIGGDTLREWEERIRDELRGLAGRWGGRWLGSGEERSVGEAVDAAMSDLVARVEADAARRNARIDTPASYAEVERRCRAW
jgi:hypothetical protein